MRSVNPANYSAIAAHLKLPNDEHFNYTPQFDGYTRGTVIKQADTVLIGYPLLYDALPPAVQANNVDYYEPVTRDSGPAMTWSMHAVNRLQLMQGNAGDEDARDGVDKDVFIGDDGERRRADVLFRRGYQGYVREPFMVGLL